MNLSRRVRGNLNWKSIAESLAYRLALEERAYLPTEEECNDQSPIVPFPPPGGKNK